MFWKKSPIDKSKKNYKFITGTDDEVFCQKISDALEEGYQLYGEPKLSHDGTKTICGQAVVVPNKSNSIW